MQPPTAPEETSGAPGTTPTPGLPVMTALSLYWDRMPLVPQLRRRDAVLMIKQVLI